MKETLKEKLYRIPKWAWFLGPCYYLFQFGMYRFGDWLSHVLGTYDNVWCPKFAPIDDLFPIVPFFSVIYVYSFAFWVFALMTVAMTKRKNFVNFIVGLCSACLIGFLVFAIFPSYMDRVAEGVIDAAAKPGVFTFVLRCIQFFDGGDIAFDLFPSYHCIMSLYCYFGVRKQPEITKGYKVYSIIMTVLICAACLLIKQHYFIDVISGLAISTICYIVVQRIDPSRYFIKE